MAGAAADPRARLLFGLGTPSRLMRIIVLQNSSEPNQPLLPTGRHWLQSTPFPTHWPEAKSSETGSEFPPASRTPAAALPAILELSTSRRRPESFQCALLPRWRGRSRTSSEFRAL